MFGCVFVYVFVCVKWFSKHCLVTTVRNAGLLWSTGLHKSCTTQLIAHSRRLSSRTCLSPLVLEPQWKSCFSCLGLSGCRSWMCLTFYTVILICDIWLLLMPRSEIQMKQQPGHLEVFFSVSVLFSMKTNWLYSIPLPTIWMVIDLKFRSPISVKNLVDVQLYELGLC